MTTTPAAGDENEDLRFAPVSGTASRKDLLAGADLLAKAVMSGGVPRREDEKGRDANS
ncbi:MAG: hypothetical protein OXP66_02835 [Candidatus Tectomicrobia bacterium]|nr:hypothetical protein [Candidatus Tectomicrobia bacterium]